MQNLYYPGDQLFLYAAFEKGLNIITERYEQSQLTDVDNSKSGLYINGELVSYEQFLQYYSDYLIDPAADTTYYAYNSYYTNSYLNGYLNWVSPYYVRSFEDTSTESTSNEDTINQDTTNQDISSEDTSSEDTSNEDTSNEIIEIISHRMQCRILHDEDGEIYEDLEWTDMNKMGNNEFYYVYCIPYDYQSGQYKVIYKSIYDASYYNSNTKEKYSDEQLDSLNFNKHNEHKVMYSSETFYVSERSDIYEDVVKIIGTVNYQRSNIPAEDVRISIYEVETDKKVYQSLTDREGNWIAYLYPNNYRFVFHRHDYNDETIYAEVTDNANQLPFETVSLNKIKLNKGNGLFRIIEKYITKKGQPIPGLIISIYSINNPTNLLIETITDEEGIWEAYLDDGFYIVKISGTALNAGFDRTFRLKINQDGKYWFDNITANILTNENMPDILNGNGCFDIVDYTIDKWGNPISDIQVNIFEPDVELLDDNILAQCYTDTNGKYIFHLNPGKYIFEYYHPNFKTITETKIIDANGNVTTE